MDANCDKFLNEKLLNENLDDGVTSADISRPSSPINGPATSSITSGSSGLVSEELVLLPLALDS